MFLLFLFLTFPTFSFRPIKVPTPVLDRLKTEIELIPDFILSPRLSESVYHMLLDFDKQTVNHSTIDSHQKKAFYDGYSRTFIDDCSNFDFPPIFPKFLCALLYVYRFPNGTQPDGASQLFETFADAVAFLNNRSSYACLDRHLIREPSVDVVAVISNRIFIGCQPLNVGITGRFLASFVIDHPFPPIQKCSELPVKSSARKCELRSVFIDNMMVYEQRSCCCQDDDCFLLIHSQNSTLTPLILETVSLSQMQKIRKRTRW